MKPTKPHRPPKRAPDFDSFQGLQELRRLLFPLAVAYDEARIEEAHAWQVFQDARQTTPDAGPEYSAAMDGRDTSIKARRALADGAVRLLVRGDALDCPCHLCSLERRMLEDFPPMRRREKKASRGKAERKKKGGGHV